MPDANPTTEPSPINRRRAWILGIVTALIVLGLGGLAVGRYAWFRLESRELRQEGIELVEDGQFRQAADVIAQYRLRRPKDTSMLLWLGRAHLQITPATRDHALQALAAIDGYLEDSPDDRAAQLYRLQALVQAQAQEQAHAYAQQLHASMPTQPLPLAVTLQGLAAAGEHEQVIQVATRALATPLPRPGFQQAGHEALLNAHLALGQRAQATRWAREAMAYQPVSPAALSRWIQVTPAADGPENWIEYVDALTAGSDTDRRVLRALALHHASNRSEQLNRPTQANAYRAELDQLLTQSVRDDALSAEQTVALADLLQARGELDRQADLLQAQANREQATDPHRLLWVRRAFQGGLWQPVLDAGQSLQSLAPDARPDWLDAYLAVAAQRAGQPDAAATPTQSLQARPDATQNLWLPVLDDVAPNADWLVGLQAAWPTLNEPLLLHKMAQSFLQHAHPAAAAGSWQRAAAAAPAWDELRLFQADALLKLGRWEQAQALLISLAPDTLEHHAELAASLRAQALVQSWDWLSNQEKQAARETQSLPANAADPSAPYPAMLALLTDPDRVPQTADAWANWLQAFANLGPTQSDAPDAQAWQAWIDLADRHLPRTLGDPIADAVDALDQVPAGLALVWADRLHQRGQSQTAQAWFNARADRAANRPDADQRAADWLLARAALADRTNAPDAWALSQALLAETTSIQPDQLLDALPRWTAELLNAGPLRHALQQRLAEQPALAFATGLNLDAQMDALVVADDNQDALPHARSLLDTVRATATQAPDSVLERLDRFLLVAGDYRGAVNLRNILRSQRPRDPRPLASLGQLLRLAGDNQGADRLLELLINQAQTLPAADRPDADAAGLLAVMALHAALEQLGENADAARLLDRYLANLPADAHPRVRQLKLRHAFDQQALDRPLPASLPDLLRDLWAGPRDADRTAALAALPLYLSAIEASPQQRSDWLAEFNQTLQAQNLDPSNHARLVLQLTQALAPDRLADTLQTFLNDPAVAADPRFRQAALASAVAQGRADDAIDLIASADPTDHAWLTPLQDPDAKPALRRVLAATPNLRAALEQSVRSGRELRATLDALDPLTDNAPTAPTGAASTATDSSDPTAPILAWNTNLQVARIAAAFEAADPTDPSYPEQVAAQLDRLGLVLVSADVTPQFAQRVLNTVIRTGDLRRANHFATLLSAAGQDLSLALASLRAAAGATDKAANLAERWASQNTQRVQRADYAAELAAIFIAGNRFEEARNLLLPQLSRGPDWQRAAVDQLDKLARHPGELSVWVQRLGPVLSLDQPRDWMQLVNAAFVAADAHGSLQPANAARRWLQDRRLNQPQPLPPNLELAYEAQLGILAQVLRDFEGMAEHYAKVLAAQPDNAMVLNNYADGLASLGQNLDQALDYAQRVVQLQPQLPDVHDTLARVLVARNQPQAALAPAQQAIDLDPDNAKWHVAYLGKLLDNQQLDAARDALETLDDRLAPDAPDPLRFNATDLRALAEHRQTLTDLDTQAAADQPASRAAQARAEQTEQARAQLEAEARQTAQRRAQREAQLRAQFEAEQQPAPPTPQPETAPAP